PRILTPLVLLFVFLYLAAVPRHLHSFPTRRSSDLRPILERHREYSRWRILFFQPIAERILAERDGGHVAGDARIFHAVAGRAGQDRKSTRLNSSHDQISYAVFCLKKQKKKQQIQTY